MKVGEGTQYQELCALLREYRPPAFPGIPSQVFRPIEIKVLGQTTLGAALGALFLKFEIHTDDEQLARIRPRLAKRKNARSEMPAQRRRSWFQKKPDLARDLRLRQLALQSPAERRRIAQVAARARWRGRRAAERRPRP